MKISLKHPLVALGVVGLFIVATVMVLYFSNPRPPVGSDILEPYLEVTDALNRTIRLKAPPQRVVSLAPSITETLAYLGVLDRVVGVDSYSLASDYLGLNETLEARNVVDVGGYWYQYISVEKILELSPDVVLADAGAHAPLKDTFEFYNITSIFLHGGSSKSINEVAEDMRLLAKIFDLNSSMVEEFLAEAEERYSSARSRLGLEGKRVLIVLYSADLVWVAGRDTFISNLFEKLGAVNVIDKEGWVSLSLEQVLRANPELVLATADSGFDKTIDQQGLSGLRVVVLSQEASNALQRPGPRILDVPDLLYKDLVESGAVG